MLLPTLNKVFQTKGDAGIVKLGKAYLRENQSRRPEACVPVYVGV